MDETWVDRIPAIWQAEVDHMIALSRRMAVLLSPRYPHRRGWRWWHNHMCAPCMVARAAWEARSRATDV